MTEQIMIEAKYTLIDIPPHSLNSLVLYMHSCLLSLIHVLDHEIKVHELT